MEPGKRGPTSETRGGSGCTSALLFGVGTLSLGLWWTSIMFSEGGDGTAFLIGAVAAYILALLVLFRAGSRKPPAE